MSFAIMTDTSANIPNRLLNTADVSVLPFPYYVNGVEHTCTDIEAFDGDAYYSAFRTHGDQHQVTTSQVNMQMYTDHLEPLLRAGKDVLIVTMSSGISGTARSADMAVAELRTLYPDRHMEIIDSLGASLGEGLLVLHALECREAGMTLSETADALRMQRARMGQIFLVDDLMFLRRGGRVSGATALVGTMLQIKPILKGNENGQIVVIGKTRGRRAAIDRLVAMYDEYVVDAERQRVGIAQAGCPEDAAYLAERLRRSHPPREILTVCYEPVTGSHVGPGALALFFESTDGVRTRG